MDVLGSQAPQDQNPTGLTNDFNNIPDVSIEQLAETQRVQPRSVATGVTQGTWRINGTDGSYITIGVIPDSGNKFGIAFFRTDGTEWMRAGELPDGTNEIVIAETTSAVKDAFS